MRVRRYKPIYAPRPSGDAYMRPLEKELVDKVLLNAVEELADRDGEDSLEELYEGRRPEIGAAHRRQIKDTQYIWSLSAYLDEDASEEDTFLIYHVELCEDTTKTIDDLTPEEREQLIELLRGGGDEYNDLIDEINKLPTSDDDPILITRMIKTTYLCSQEKCAIKKYYDIDYLINGESIMYLSDDPADSASTSEYATDLRDLVGDLNLSEAEDLSVFYEVLYHLGLPGGRVSEDVTKHYVDMKSYTCIDD